MKVRTEVALPIALLLTVLALVTLGAVGLLWRMAPAIERIRGENLYSLAAVEQMLEAVARSRHQPGEAEVMFADGLERARRNVTGESEGPLLDTIQGAAPGALAGDQAELDRLLPALRSLSEVHHASVERADDDAKRMGTAGAWAAVLLGLVGAILSTLAVLRLSRSVIRPTVRLHDVARSREGGDRYRRAGRIAGALELQGIGRCLDELLDESDMRAMPAAPSSEDAPALRKALLHYLERESRPTLLVDERSHVIAANAKALGAGGPDAEALPHPGLGESPPEGCEVLSANLWLVRR